MTISTQIIFMRNNHIQSLLDRTGSVLIHWHRLIELDLLANAITTLPNHDRFWKSFPEPKVLSLRHNKLGSIGNVIESLQFISTQIITIQNTNNLHFA